MKRVHTHYDNLKVTRDAPQEVIRAAYKTLCNKFHPDRNGGSQRATQTFQLINNAYEVLSDPERRRQHDEWIARAEAGQVKAEVPRAWNGKERRRRPWAQPAGPAVADFAGRLRRPGKVLMLWASALVGAMLFLLYHA